MNYALWGWLERVKKRYVARAGFAPAARKGDGTVKLIKTLTPIALVAIIGVACLPTPQLDIDFTVRKTGTYRTEEQLGLTVTFLTMSGILACSGGSTSSKEPLDLFLSVTPPGGVAVTGAEANDTCQTNPKIWTKTWEVTFPPGSDMNGKFAVAINACTNPGEFIDEDCQLASESVTFSPA